MNLYREKSSQRVYGMLGDDRAFLQDGEVFVVVGRDNGWVRIKGRVNEFRNFTQAEANEPRNQVGLGMVAQGKLDRYWGKQ